MQPLAGYRVVDFTHVVAGPLATFLLRLLGAEVIKIEGPGGDPFRNYSLVPQERGMAPAFVGINAGKKSVVLDLKSEEGRATATTLVESADVVVENFRPGVIERLGFGFEDCKRIRPGIIHCSVSGFGQDGPLRDNPAIDQIVQSLSGLMRVSGEEPDGPIRIGIPIVDTYTGVLAALAIVSALLQRERFSGEGQRVDVAMLDATIVMMFSVVNPWLINRTPFTRVGNRGFSRAPTADTFPTADGGLTVGAVQEGQVRRFFECIGLKALIGDPRFSDRDVRMENAEALQAEIVRALSMKPASEWGELLAAAGVPAGEVLDFTDVLDRGWIDARDLKMSIPFGEGSVEILNAGFKFAEHGPGLAEAAPALGEHTESVRAALRR